MQELISLSLNFRTHRGHNQTTMHYDYLLIKLLSPRALKRTYFFSRLSQGGKAGVFLVA
jgi:hypothetical protein